MQALVIDDHPPIRKSMTTTLKLLAKGLGKEIQISSVGGCDEALRIEDKANFDLILLDYHLDQGLKGIEALVAIKNAFKSSTVVMYSGESDPDVILETIEKGAGGFIHKSFDDKLTIDSLETILRGGIVLPPQALGGLRPDRLTLSPPDQRRRSEISKTLTPSVTRVLKFAVQGLSNDQIAAEINRSKHTVKKHLSEAYRVLSVGNRTQAVYVSAELQLFVDEQ